MHFTGALTIVLALTASAGDERVLLCRPEVSGDPAKARGEAIAEAAAKLRGKFLEYGAECKDPGEGARAARRAGLAHALVGKADAMGEGSRYELVLSDAEAEDDGIRARRLLEVKADAEAVPALKRELRELLRTLPPKPGPDPEHVAAWTVAGAGAAAVIAGLVISSQADEAEHQASEAKDPSAYTSKRKRAKQKRNLANMTMGVGAAAVAGGLTWRFVF
jgi:hypothetical protein